MCLMCAHTWGCSWVKSMDPCGSNAVSHVSLRQKLVPVAQIKRLHIWDKCASFGKKRPQPLRILSTLRSCKSCSNQGAICTSGTSNACIKNRKFDIFCGCCVPMGVYNVPDVCTWLRVCAISKSNVQSKCSKAAEYHGRNGLFLRSFGREGLSLPSPFISVANSGKIGNGSRLIFNFEINLTEFVVLQPVVTNSSQNRFWKLFFSDSEKFVFFHVGGAPHQIQSTVRGVRNFFFFEWNCSSACDGYEDFRKQLPKPWIPKAWGCRGNPLLVSKRTWLAYNSFES